MEPIRIILKDTVRSQDLDLLAFVHGWRLWNEIQADETTPYQRIWVTADQQTAIHQIEDALLGVRYLQIRGDEAALVAEQAGAMLEVYALDELPALVVSADPALVKRAVSIAALMATAAFQAELFEVFGKALAHPDPGVRQTTILAMAYPAWPQFRPLLERVRQLDPKCGTAANEVLRSLNHPSV